MLTLAAAVYQRSPDADPSRALPMRGDRADPAAPRRAAAGASGQQVADTAERYRAELKLAGLRDGDVVPGNTSARVVQRVRLSAAKASWRRRSAWSARWSTRPPSSP